VTRTITMSVDQLFRAQPGGIGTYVRGLAMGLGQLDDPDLEVVGLAPRGGVRGDVHDLNMTIVTAGLSQRLLTRVWPYRSVGVPKRSDVVHATSMAGPFAGGSRSAVHSVAMHDLLWRDEPATTTRSGARFHESRLRLLARRGDIRVFTSSPTLAARLVDDGFTPDRLHRVRLGVDDDAVEPASTIEVTTHLARHGVAGPFTLYAGTREPRKNIEVLIRAHRDARSAGLDLGPLVLAGSSGWGEVHTDDAVVLGVVERSLLKGLFRDATLFVYIPRAEGWGLPPVEALFAGTRVVASTTTPSVGANDEVVLVDPFDQASVVDGLGRAMELADDEVARARRRASVDELTWRNCALDHVAGWR